MFSPRERKPSLGRSTLNPLVIVITLLFDIVSLLYNSFPFASIAILSRSATSIPGTTIGIKTYQFRIKIDSTYKVDM